MRIEIDLINTGVNKVRQLNLVYGLIIDFQYLDIEIITSSFHSFPKQETRALEAANCQLPQDIYN